MKRFKKGTKTEFSEFTTLPLYPVEEDDEEDLLIVETHPEPRRKHVTLFALSDGGAPV